MSSWNAQKRNTLSDQTTTLAPTKSQLGRLAARWPAPGKRQPPKKTVIMIALLVMISMNSPR